MFICRAEALYAKVVLICAILAVCVPGCRQKEKLGAVSGKVTFQGQPVGAGAVVFTNKSKGVFMTAKIDEQGQFKVVMAKGAGLPPGEYQISVSPPVPDIGVGAGPMPGPVPECPFVPRRYRDYKTSGLTLTVPEEGTTLNIDMTP